MPHCSVKKVPRAQGRSGGADQVKRGRARQGRGPGAARKAPEAVLSSVGCGI